MNKKILNLDRDLKNNESGAVLPFFALILVILLGLAAFAVDFGFAAMRQAQLQAVADAEALACARDYSSCTGSGTQFPLTNPYAFTISMNKGVDCPNTATQKNCAQATASTSWDTYFLPVFGIPSINLSKTAIAGTPIVPDALIVREEIRLNGTKNQVLVGSGSVATGGVITAKGLEAGVIASVRGATITTYKGADTTQCDACIPSVKSSSAELPIPPPYSPPAQPALQTYVDNTCGLPSGTYVNKVDYKCASITNLTGVYYFNGGFDNDKGKSPITGTGVTIIVGVDQPFSMTGNVNLNSLGGGATCATSVGGGMLIYQPVSLSGYSSNMDDGGGGGGSGNNIQLTGRVELPNTRLTLGGASSTISFTGSVYAKSLTLNGNLSSSTSPDPCQNTNIGSGATILVQ